MKGRIRASQRWIGLSEDGGAARTDVKLTARPEVAFKLATIGGSIRLRLLLILGSIAVLCVFAIFGGRLFRSESPIASGHENAPVQPSSAQSSVPAGPAAPGTFSSAAVDANQPRQVNATTPSSEEDRPSVLIVADRPRFVGATTPPAQRKAAQNDVRLQKAALSLRDYRSAFNQNPVGSNAEITRALSGKNSRGRRYLPTDAQLNNKGELTDRWDQPLFFHQISGTKMEIRSAGPDHVMWTNDDEVLR